MKLTLGFSPCPNDTFIFDALIHNKIDTEGLEFEVFFDDVETLNQKALNGILDITKLSFHTLAFTADKYALLNAGSALGFGVGPLLISKKYDEESFAKISDVDCKKLVVGIPGKYTTANFLLGIAYPDLVTKKEMVFSEIENGLLDNELDLGLIIHENRFTYQDKNLHKIIDLGSYWETITGCAIPLGGIVVNRKLDKDVQLKVDRLIRKSVEYAFANPEASTEFTKQHAQSMQEDIIKKHIELYVNKYSIELGEDGRNAVDMLFEWAQKRGIINSIPENLYV